MRSHSQAASDLLQEHGFNDAIDVAGIRSIAARIPQGRRCGIYVLHFADGQFYVGQSVEVAKRFLDHCKSHPDIIKVSFREVDAIDLDAHEIATIKVFEAEKLQLRNVDIVTWTYARTSFDDLMPVADQNRWLVDLGWVDDAGERAVDLALRTRTARKLAALRKRGLADAAIAVARRYIMLAIPAIRRSEQRFWSISAVPGPSHILVRLSLNEQEVMTLYEDGGALVLSLHMARLPLAQRLRLTRLASLRHRTSIWATDHRYPAGGEDQLNMSACGEPSINYLLSDRTVQRAVRRMNLRLMRRGRSFYSKTHCMDLAALILDGEDALLARER